VQKGEVLSIMDIGLLWTEEVDGEVVAHLREHNFVFGEADAGRGCAIISLARLGLPPAEGKPAAVLFRRRALTVAVHEIGHLLGLGHCPKEDCVMHFSNSLADTDRKSPEFCKRCRDQLPVT
jgi:archaemetzincin